MPDDVSLKALIWHDPDVPESMRVEIWLVQWPSVHRTAGPAHGLLPCDEKQAWPWMPM